jgi:hypothetical protein
MRFAAVGLAMLLMGSSGAQGQDAMTFNGIVRGCHALLAETSVDIFNQGVCVGLVQGVLNSDPNVCSPSRSTLGQAVRVVLAYADKIPERWHERREKIVVEALRRAWPCRR